MNINVTKIDTKPQRDCFRAGVYVTKTVLYLDPASRTVCVEQEQDDNATPVDVWHELRLVFAVPGHPHEDRVQEFLDNHRKEIEAICAGYSTDWDGSNLVGRYSDEAREAIETISDGLEEVFDYEDETNSYFLEDEEEEGMTAREFLEWAGYEADEETVLALSQYLAHQNVDFAQFPDVYVVADDGTPLAECFDEPANFQEWMDGRE